MTAVRGPDDVRAVWRKHCGDKPVPARDHRAERLRRALIDADRERERRDQLEIARQRLEGANRAPWPDAEAAWLDALRIAKAVFTP